MYVILPLNKQILGSFLKMGAVLTIGRKARTTVETAISMMRMTTTQKKPWKPQKGWKEAGRLLGVPVAPPPPAPRPYDLHQFERTHTRVE